MDDRPASRTGAVMEAIRRRIASRALLTGDRLPSIRALAKTMGLSPSTVVEAYGRLAAEGLILSRPGSGFYVGRAAVPLELARAETPRMRQVDPFWVSRQSLDAGPDLARPGCGWLPADWMPQATIRRALRGVVRADGEALAGYGPARGDPGLRQLLSRQFCAAGLDVGPDGILLTGSGTQGLDLLCRLLLTPGDTVLVDDPCYFNFRALLQVHRVEIVGVPMTPSGPDLTRFAEAAAAHRPRLYVTNSALHNPTGATMSAGVAHRILTIAAEHDMRIVEDEIFADFEPEPSVRLAALDGLERVMRVGSFSKALSASVRCGYIAARPDWIETLVDLQVATNFSSVSPIAARTVHAALADGTYARHMAGLTRRLSHARRDVGARLTALGIRRWTDPRGGFLLWCALPDGIDAADLSRAALREQVLLAPGDIFSPSGTAPGFMRFNVAQMDDPRVFEVIERALAGPAS